MRLTKLVLLLMLSLFLISACSDSGENIASSISDLLSNASINADEGIITDENGNTIATIDEDGTIRDTSGNVIGEYDSQTGSIKDASGNSVGTVGTNGTIDTSSSTNDEEDNSTYNITTDNSTTDNSSDNSTNSIWDNLIVGSGSTTGNAGSSTGDSGVDWDSVSSATSSDSSTNDSSSDSSDSIVDWDSVNGGSSDSISTSNGVAYGNGTLTNEILSAFADEFILYFKSGENYIDSSNSAAISNIKVILTYLVDYYDGVGEFTSTELATIYGKMVAEYIMDMGEYTTEIFYNMITGSSSNFGSKFYSNITLFDDLITTMKNIKNEVENNPILSAFSDEFIKHFKSSGSYIYSSNEAAITNIQYILTYLIDNSNIGEVTNTDLATAYGKIVAEYMMDMDEYVTTIFYNMIVGDSSNFSSRFQDTVTLLGNLITNLEKINSKEAEIVEIANKLMEKLNTENEIDESFGDNIKKNIYYLLACLIDYIDSDDFVDTLYDSININDIIVNTTKFSKDKYLELFAEAK